MSFVRTKLWTDLCPTKPKTRWVAEKVLNIPPALITKHSKDLASLIYAVYHTIGPSDNKYVTAYNAARCDLVADWVRPPMDDLPPVGIAHEPEGDLSYWLISHVLLFSDNEAAALGGIPIDQVDEPGYEYVPIIKSSYRVLKGIHLQDQVLQHWHRSRHIMIRYFLDAVYHEL